MNTPNPPSPEATAGKMNWGIFFGVLLAPAVVSLLAATAKVDGLAKACPFVGGSLAGIACGTILARHVGRTYVGRILLGIVFAVLLGSLSFYLGYVGCALGGYKMEIH